MAGIRSPGQTCPQISEQGPSGALWGRRRKCAVLDRLIEAVRRDESQALVLRGEPGIGKTALLQYLVVRKSGCRAVRATSVQSEMELTFAGFYQLVAPMPHWLGNAAGATAAVGANSTPAST